MNADSITRLNLVSFKFAWINWLQLNTFRSFCFCWLNEIEKATRDIKLWKESKKFLIYADILSKILWTEFYVNGLIYTPKIRLHEFPSSGHTISNEILKNATTSHDWRVRQSTTKNQQQCYCYCWTLRTERGTDWLKSQQKSQQQKFVVRQNLF